MSARGDVPTSRPPSYVVALTGGIASGKSTVSRLFEALGTDIIDTDVIAHDLVEPGQPLLAVIAKQFGSEFISSKGRLRRRKLRELVFSQPDQRIKLEAIMHPAIRAEAQRQIAQVAGSYCLLVIPLLTETGGFGGIQRVLVVDTDRAVQLRRLSQRDDVTAAQAAAALAAQASREQRLGIADDVLENSGSLAQLEAAVHALHEQYLKLSKAWLTEIQEQPAGGRPDPS